MTDRDVVARVARLIDRALLALAPRQANYKMSYATTIKGGPAIALMRAVRSHLSVTRQGQIDRVVASWSGRSVQRRGTLESSVPFAVMDCRVDCGLPWLAGVLEGEGCFSIQRARAGTYPAISIQMTEESVIRHVAELLNSSSVRRLEPRDARWRPTYATSVYGKAAAEWMRQLSPLMSERRQAAIKAAIDSYHPVRLVDPPETCVVPDCGEPHRARGLCHKHYMSWMRDVAGGQEPRVRPLR